MPKAFRSRRRSSADSAGSVCSATEDVMEQADVVIVGAGIAGASLAYELAAEAEVLLLEREDRPGYHTTGRSAAVFAPGYGNRAIRRLTLASSAFYQDRMAGLAAGPVLHERGVLLVARPDQVAALDQALDETSQEVAAISRLDQEAVLERLPLLDPAAIAAGAFDPTSKDMDVALIHESYLRSFRARGGRLLTDAEVLALSRKGDRWQLETRAGPIGGATLVNAAGAWADEFASLAGARPIGLVPKRRTAFIFDPGVPVERAWPAVVDIGEQFYFKPDSGLLLGSPADETPMAPCDVQPEELDIALAVDRIERATTFGVKRITRKWAGLRTFVADKTPVVGFDDGLPGLFWLAGQGGYGIQTAPAMARLAAALIRGLEIPDDVAATSLAATDLAPGRLAKRTAHEFHQNFS
jgi:D-arginine dehydrogenase